ASLRSTHSFPTRRSSDLYLQLKEKGDAVNLASLLDEIRARDERDTQRAVAPLKPAHDAILLDSTKLSIEQVLERILGEVAARELDRKSTRLNSSHVKISY